MTHQTVEINLVELENKVLVFNLEDVHDGSTLRQVDKMLKQRGSKHIAIIALPEGSSLQALDKDQAKKLLNYILEQEEKKDESDPNDYRANESR